MNLSFIVWDVSPEIFNLGFFSLRWYGLLFAVGFLLGQYLMTWYFTMEKRDVKDVDGLLLYMVISTVLGARLGHCLFYEPAYYLSHPMEILKVWEGGLASHGASVGILVAIYLFAYKRYEVAVFLSKVPVLNSFLGNKNPEKPAEIYTWFYLLDRLVINIALGGAFIRMGNLMNSEIVGKPTDVAWGFIFARLYTPEGLPEDFARHPSQLYEAVFCFLLFAGLLLLYIQTKEKTPSGRIMGWFLVLLFTQRILVEFTKENQVAFENGLPLNMGQLLSVPLVLAGLFVLYKSYTQPIVI